MNFFSSPSKAQRAINILPLHLFVFPDQFAQCFSFQQIRGYISSSPRLMYMYKRTHTKTRAQMRERNSIQTLLRPRNMKTQLKKTNVFNVFTLSSFRVRTD
ncbi:unnamed protein product [Lupinus luteus]|uniref:Uncharacterized protein n=1 Tax=Lupinus luteus TaxID=3873 RepID=A0AAV1WL59_LUPLU